MNSIANRLVVAFVALAALFGGYQYVKALRSDLAAAKSEANAARIGNQERDQVIEQLRTNEEQNARARAWYEQQREGLAAASIAREKEFRRLLDENEDLRAWDDGALPFPVIRMYDRPAVTGAASYQDHLRSRSTLHDAGNKP